MIDLSKAYAGQIATLGDGTSIELQSIKPINQSQDEFAVIHSKGLRLYRINGAYIGSIDGIRDIVKLSDPIQVQIARLEGEIKGIELALNCAPLNEWSKVYAQRTILIEQLKALQDESNN